MMAKNYWDIIITAIIPVITTILVAVYQTDKHNMLIALYIGIVSLIIIVAALYSINFFKDREERWRNNGAIHQEITRRIEKIESIVDINRRFSETDEKINKLSDQMQYFRGKYDK